MLFLLIKRNLINKGFIAQLRQFYKKYFRTFFEILPSRNGNLSKLIDPIAKKLSDESKQKKNNESQIPVRDEVLFAVWDFQVSPITFDFLNFLVLADIERESKNLSAIQVVILPGPVDGFRDGKIIPISQKNYRVSSIILPAMELLACSVRPLFFSNRQIGIEFLNRIPKSDIFPNDFDYKNSFPTYNWLKIREQFDAGYDLLRLESDSRSSDLVRQWKKQHCGDKKVLTFTLRESFYETDRNSDINSIKEFIKQLDQETYAVIILRDVDRASESFDEWEKLGAINGDFAVLDLRHRFALYEQAHLNYFINNGPFVCALFSKKIKYAAFKMITPSVHVTSAEYFKKQGWSTGKDFFAATEDQKLFWQKESVNGFNSALNEFHSVGARK